MMLMRLLFLALLDTPVYTWGRGEDGQLGHGDTQDRSSPALVEALQGKIIVQMACGSGHTIVLSSACRRLLCIVWVWLRGRDGTNRSSCDHALGQRMGRCTRGDEETMGG
jgi:alpha-tubulin suppressor-like RCC1 family protein